MRFLLFRNSTKKDSFTGKISWSSSVLNLFSTGRQDNSSMTTTSAPTVSTTESEPDSVMNTSESKIRKTDKSM